MFSTRIELYSALSPVECAARLAAAMDADGLFRWGAFGFTPVIGKVSGSSLIARKRGGRRNDFKSVLYAKISADQGGTVILGKFVMGPWARASILLWIGLVVGSIALNLATRGALPVIGRNGFAILALMLGFQIALVGFSRRRGRDDIRSITDFLIQTLDGRERP